MLRHVRIRDLALLGDIAFDPEGGLSVLTGETGSGKSLIFEALGLLAGMRATPSLVRTGADRATVEAAFDVGANEPVRALLTSLGVEAEDGEELIVRREVFATGRSRAFLNGRMVPIGQLGEAAAHLLELCGQHDQQRLLDASVQRDFFDGYAGVTPLRRKVETAWKDLARAETDWEALHQGERDRLQRLEFLRFQVEEMETLAVRPGELEELEAERRRLGSVEYLAERLGAVRESVSESSSGEPVALDQLGSAMTPLEEMADRDAALAGVLESFREAHARLTDAIYDLERYGTSLESDPARLDEVTERIDTVRRVLRKHGMREDEAAERLAAMREEMERLENWDAALEDAEKRLASARAALLAAGRELSDARRKARSRFLRPLTALLRDFAMPKVRVDIRLEPIAQGKPVDGEGTLCSAAGLEEVEILFSANEGEELKPLRRVASGGELGRMMLALRTLDAERGCTPVLLFDEVDAGLSGVAARRVADRLAALGERCQVLCISHNPSIASAAHTHYIVEKRERGGRTESLVSVAEGIRREEELARLLDGGKISEKGRALAAELLERAG